MMDVGIKQTTMMVSSGDQRKRSHSLLKIALRRLGGIAMIAVLVLAETVAAEEVNGSEDEDYDAAGDEDYEDYAAGDDDFLSEHIVEIDPDHNCRDDAYINCTEAKEKGVCTGEADDVLNRRELCPVTCGICELPPRTSIWVEYPCVEHGEDITAYFTNISPEPDDFIGLFPAYLNFNSEPESLKGALMWYTACGSLHEECRTAMGGLIFGGDGPNEGTVWNNFPLEAGKYKFALVRGDERTLLAESQTFKAEAEGYSCSSECHDLVYTDQSCYAAADTSIHVGFESCVPLEDDHIVIYPQDEETPGKHEPPLWLRTCGTRTCDATEDTADTIEFALHTQSEAGGVLPPGNYRAFLMKTNEGGRYGRAFAKSASFSVKAEGESCYIEEEEDL